MWEVLRLATLSEVEAHRLEVSSLAESALSFFFLKVTADALSIGLNAVLNTLEPSNSDHD